MSAFSTRRFRPFRLTADYNEVRDRWHEDLLGDRLQLKISHNPLVRPYIIFRFIGLTRSRSQRYRPSSQSSSVQLKARCGILYAVCKLLKIGSGLTKAARAEGVSSAVFNMFNLSHIGCQQEEEGDV